MHDMVIPPCWDPLCLSCLVELLLGGDAESAHPSTAKKKTARSSREVNTIHHLLVAYLALHLYSLVQVRVCVGKLLSSEPAVLSWK